MKKIAKAICIVVSGSERYFFRRLGLIGLQIGVKISWSEATRNNAGPVWLSVVTGKIFERKPNHVNVIGAMRKPMPE